jgi:hypothetical protein
VLIAVMKLVESTELETVPRVKESEVVIEAVTLVGEL